MLYKQKGNRDIEAALMHHETNLYAYLRAYIYIYICGYSSILGMHTDCSQIGLNLRSREQMSQGGLLAEVNR